MFKSKSQGQRVSQIRRREGAWVNIVACVQSQEAFEERVKRHAKGVDCILIELENVQLLEARMSDEEYPEELIAMRETAARQTTGMVFGAFHIWHQEDSN